MFDYGNSQLFVLNVQGYENKQCTEGELMNKPVLFVLFTILNHSKDNDSDDDEDSDIKDGLFIFYRATTDLSLKEIFPQCKHRLCYMTWDCHIIYLVANKWKTVDWSKVKRNVRECAELEGAITKNNKSL
eukprot:4032096-Ditylum_brightwellii.AAC.1